MTEASCPRCGRTLGPDGRCPGCDGATTEAPTRSLQRDDSAIAERYRLIRRLGEGGMGEVWLAFDGRLECQVALKFVSEKMARDPEARERFYREIRLARQVRHPNVAAVYDLFEDRDRAFFTMEFVPGKSLDELLGEPQPLADALRLARDIARGLAALHEAGIVHRDVKPGNVRVTPEGRAVLLDLGIAKDLSQAGMTHSGWIVGTPDHMAPEQALGRQVTPSADVYAVGLLLYRLLTGKRLELDVLGDDSPTLAAPSQLNPQVPEWLDRVIAVCLDRSPRRRYASAVELLRDLEGERRPTTRRTVTLTRRTLAGITAGTALVLAAIAAAGVAWWLGRDQPVPLTTHRLTTAAGLETGGTLSPNGRFVVYAARGSDTFDLFLRTVGRGEPLQLTRTDDLDEGSAAFSNDSTHVALSAYGPGGGIFSIAATGGERVQVAGRGTRPRWSPDDRRLLYQTGFADPPPRDVLIAEMPDGDGGGAEPLSLRRRFSIDLPIHSGAWLSGHEVAAAVGDREVWRFDLRSGERQRLFGADGALRDLCTTPPSRQIALLVSGADGWQPHLWHRGELRPVGSGGYLELTGCLEDQLLLTRSEPQMRLLGATLAPDGSLEPGSFRPLEAAAAGGFEQREFMPDLSPGGEHLAFVSSRSGELQVWLKPLPDGEPRRVSTHGGEHRWPAFSPDGRFLAYSARAVGTGDVLVYDLEAGTETNLTATPGDYEGAPDWFPDGGSLVVNLRVGRRWDLARVSFPGGERTLLTDDAALDIDPAVSPDGGRIAFHREGRLQVLDLASGEIVPLVPGSTPRWRADGQALLFQADGDLWSVPVPWNGEPPVQLTHHPWPARHLEGVWKFSLRGDQLTYSVVEHPAGDLVLLAPEGGGLP